MVNRDNIKYLIEEIAKFSEITSEFGTTRQSYTKEYRGAINFLKDYMEKQGLEVHEDGVGIVYGRFNPNNSQEDIVLTGSHIDTVCEGGNYDGVAGVVTGIEAIVAIKNSGVSLKRPVEVIIMTEEEACRYNMSLFSSRAVMGEVTEREIAEIKDLSGITMRDAMILDGLSADLSTAVRNDINSMVELHIEQGPILENKGMDIGAVTSIVELMGIGVSVCGYAGHAGTTPMIGRRDAMVAAANCIANLEKMAKEFGNNLVLTVGVLTVKPSSSNVIPYQVDFEIDLRCHDDLLLTKALNEVYKVISETVGQFGCTAIHKELFRKARANMKEQVVDCILDNAQKLGYKNCKISSGAGHDSQIFAKKVATAMIFIPCKDGRSHCKEEFSTTEQLGKGADVLEKVLVELANK